MQRSQNGCNWSGTIGSNDVISINTSSSTYAVTTPLVLDRPVTIKSSQNNVLVTVKQNALGADLFDVSTESSPYVFTFQDLHMVGLGKINASSNYTGINGLGNSYPSGGTINVNHCLIEQFSNAALDVSNMTLNVRNSIIDNNSAPNGNGGGGIFYENTDAFPNANDFFTIEYSTVSHNYSAKAGGIQIQSNTTSRILNSTIAYNVTTGRGGGVSFGNNDTTLKGGRLIIAESTIAFNGTTVNAGGGISQLTNDPNLPNNVDIEGSIVAENCFATLNADKTFKCKTGSSAVTDYAGDLDLLSDALLGNNSGVTNWSTLVSDGVTYFNVPSGLNPTLSDPYPVTGQVHPNVLTLQFSTNGVKSIAVDGTNWYNNDEMDLEGRFCGDNDETGHARGFNHTPDLPGTPADFIYDLGAFERRTNP